MPADATTPPPTMNADLRDTELAALADYVRLLADRMGLRDWTFEVRRDEGIATGEFAEAQSEYRRPYEATLLVSSEFFRAMPEDRRDSIARELVYQIIASTDELTTFDPMTAAAIIAAAWAPCLPLPLVGLMRRVKAET